MLVAIGYASIWILEGGQLETVAEKREPPPLVAAGPIPSTDEEKEAARAAMRLTDTDFAYSCGAAT
jgi:hypothetical protein